MSHRRLRAFKSTHHIHSPLSGPVSLLHSHLKADDIHWPTADRLNVLHGHTGCVNALSWSANGEILLSAGDDRTLRLWRLDPLDIDSAWPFTTRACIRTGHSANIFNVQFLARHSPSVATCAGDRQVRIFDISRIAAGDPTLQTKSYKGIWDDTLTNDACVRVINCHRGRVKRIATEDTDTHFLTVAEDGSVRQHDLRVPHRCQLRRKECPPPLIKLTHQLYTLALSPLTPYYFVVAGASPHAHLFDRRHCSRSLIYEWGMQSTIDSMATCVRTFGRDRRGSFEKQGEEHITGARMSHSVPHELLLSYSADAIYLYSTRDEPLDSSVLRQPVISHGEAYRPTSDSDEVESSDDDSPLDMDADRDSTEEEPDRSLLAEQIKSPLVLPRQRFTGACNVDTVKDVNFLGHEEQFITSGSDDGNFFVWSRETGELLNILEGDESVVNVIEQNPYYSCVAVSGIDHTVKVFGRGVADSTSFSRLPNRDEIIQSNAERPSQYMSHRMDILNMIARYRLAAFEDGGEEGSTCVYQ